MPEAIHISILYEIEGVVQGVGFRPALHRLASGFGLVGWVRNDNDRVTLRLEGRPDIIGHFIAALPKNLPPLAQITIIRVVEKTVMEEPPKGAFEIIDSGAPAQTAGSILIVPADAAMCRECEREILDPENRRHGYPFTTCVDCGPRHTVVLGTPYDRGRTTLRDFPLCEQCQKEYESPSDRRHHAESLACPKCGPQLSLRNADGKELSIKDHDILRKARAELAAGKILAIRGIGGFLLASDALNLDTIATLRTRKSRPHKPFAVMFADIETVFDFCSFNAEAVKLLSSPASPIVILPLNRSKLDKTASKAFDAISPDTDTIGAMIPYSPLHKLLFEPLPGDPTPPFRALIMTSGNKGGEPIATANDEALEKLSGIADLFVIHNREINIRNDDSIAVTRDKSPQLWRRARGYAPSPVDNQTYSTKTLLAAESALAMGAGLKNTIAVSVNQKIFVSPHIGDLDNPETFAALKKTVERLPRLIGATPKSIAVDKHPDMPSTILGKQLAKERSLPLLEIQHHHAHAAACMGEHGLNEAIAIVFDGTGLGDDGSIWGGEAFFVNIPKAEFERLASFAPVPLPGGDAAVIHPARQLVARLKQAGVELKPTMLKQLKISKKQLEMWSRQCEQSINAPLTSAAGRLFDSVSATLGVAPEQTTYEGQAAIRLEALALRAASKLSDSPAIPPEAFFKFKAGQKGPALIDWTPFFAETAPTLIANSAPEARSAEIALAFHHAAAGAAMTIIHYIRSKHRIDNIVLSGGVFMNKILTELLLEKIREAGLTPHIHRQIPPNDGGISFGQAVLAAASPSGKTRL